MARKRQNVAQKRVLKKATDKNVGFVVQALPELKREISTTQEPKSVPRKSKSAGSAKSIDVQPKAADGEAVTIATYDFNKFSNAEDVDMGEPLPPPQPQTARTYSRKRSIDQLIQEWETAPGSSNQESSIQNGRIETHSSADIRVDELGEKGVMSAPQNCTCGKAEEAEKYKMLSESLQREKDALVLKNSQLEVQNGKLLESLTSQLLPKPEKPFKEEEGFLDCETLQRMSHEAGDKDYLFLKFLMVKLFPEGLVGRSVTGRSSNNPSGRPKKKDAENTAEDIGDDSQEKQASKVPLDPVKVRWIKRRLYDRRIFLRDDCSVANACYRNAGRLMTRVIANTSR